MFGRLSSVSAAMSGTWVSDEEDERRRVVWERLVETCERQLEQIRALRAERAELRAELEVLREEGKGKGKGEGKAAEGRCSSCGALLFVPFTPGLGPAPRYDTPEWHAEQERRYAAMQQKAASKAAGKGKDGEGKGNWLARPRRERSRSPAWVRNLPPSPQTPPDE